GSNKGVGPASGASPGGRRTWALTLTLTAVVELDVAVDVEPLVDLYLDHRSRLFNEDSETTRRSTYNVQDGLNVHVDALRQRQGQPQRLREDVPGLHRHFFSPTAGSCSRSSAAHRSMPGTSPPGPRA